VIVALEDKDLNNEKGIRTIEDINLVLHGEKRDGPFRLKELFTFGETQNFRRLLITISIQL